MTSETLYYKAHPKRGTLHVRLFGPDDFGPMRYRVDWQEPGDVWMCWTYPRFDSGSVVFSADDDVPVWVKRTATAVIQRR